MEKFIRLFIAAVFAISFCGVQAQDRATAVLQHGNTPKVFYGNSAFVDALDQAQTGDVISLSNGVFDAPEAITKSVKIQGVGTTANFAAALTVNLPEGASGFWLEGVKTPGLTVNGNISNMTIQRCKLDGTSSFKGKGEQLLLSQCRIANIYYTGDIANFMVNNCIISGDVRGDQSTTEPLTFNNCIINSFSLNFNSNYLSTITQAIIRNSIIIDTVCNKPDASFINCVYRKDGGYKPSDDAYIENCTTLSSTDISKLFKNKTDYVLTADAASKYVGSDGTQIGVYGGATPFTDIPAIPRIINASVPTTVGNDGKLPVTITVEVNN